MSARHPRACPPSPRGQRGVALIVALLVVALAVILLAGLLDRGELALARTRNVLRGEQAQAYAEGLEAYAAQVLLRTRSEGGRIDHNASVWNTPLPAQPVPGGLISARLRDLNGCFNLNNLAPDRPDLAAWQRVFRRLLSVRGADPAIADAVTAWLGGQAGNDEGYYLAQPVPYRPARRAFAHASELRLVRGVAGEVQARLAPYVCAVPAGSRINVNTAGVPVLMALAETITQGVAERAWNGGQARWNDVAAFGDFLRGTGVALDPSTQRLLGVESSYFLARGQIVLDEVPFAFTSLIERRDGVGIRVLARSRGADEAWDTPGTPPAPETVRPR